MSADKVFVLLLGAAGIVVALTIVLILKKDNSEKSVSAGAPFKGFDAMKQPAGEKNNHLTDYNVYTMSKREKLLNLLTAAAVIFTLGFVFYRNPIISLILTPLSFLYPKFKTRELIRKRKNELNDQFKEALYSLSSSLTAGKSIELSFKEALRDLAIQYTDPDTAIIREFEYIVRRLEMNETVEAALQDFADRAHLEDISSFVNVLQVCKRSGGNLVQVIKNSTDILRDKMEIKQEIDTMLAEKRFEQKVLNAMPVLMILFISASAGDFMKPVFTTIAGNLVMTLAIGILAAAYLISKKIMDIEV